MNVVSLIGTLSSDPELREQRRLCSFRLAVVRPGGAGACVLRVVATDRQADQCARFLKQGMRVALDGGLRSRTWTDDDGKRQSTVEVVASSFNILSSPAEAAA